MVTDPIEPRHGTVVHSKKIFTDENEQSIEFEWQFEWVTPELREAVGTVTLEWAMLDAKFTDLCRSFWHPNEGRIRLPRAFDLRAKFIQENVANIYMPRSQMNWRRSLGFYSD
jgi:hypothetical protein